MFRVNGKVISNYAAVLGVIHSLIFSLFFYFIFY